METKALRVLEAAQKLFVKHGFKKVTMSEIAAAAQMSRPTLYALYANIEEVLSALVILTRNQNDEKTVEALSTKKAPLKEKLEILFDIWIIEPFAQIIDSENARDLLANCAQYAPDAIDALYDNFEKHVIAILKPEMNKKHSMTPQELARILTLATKGFKAAADDLPALKRLVKGLILMTMGTIG